MIVRCFGSDTGPSTVRQDASITGVFTAAFVTLFILLCLSPDTSRPHSDVDGILIFCGLIVTACAVMCSWSCARFRFTCKHGWLPHQECRECGRPKPTEADL